MAVESIWAAPVKGRRYVRHAMVCEGKYEDGYWLAADKQVEPACGYVEPPGTPQKDRGYNCPNCGGALLRRMVEATHLDLVEDWVENVYRNR